MPASDYEVIDTINDPDGMGLVAELTRFRRSNGFTGVSFAIFKEFERRPGGPTERTSYLNQRHLGAARKLLDLIEDRMAQETERFHAARRSS